MADISKLTDRILSEAKESADLIIAQADEKVKKIEQNSRVQAEAKYKAIVEKGKLDAQNLKERLKSNANLKSRDNELRVKQEVILRVYESALDDLKNIDSESYLEYIKEKAGFGDSELIVTKDRVDLVKEKFPEANISTERFVETGFIEICGGVEKNYTFDAQLDYIKDDLQGEIAKVLFGRG